MKKLKFFTFTNLAISIDGKIASKDRALCHLGSRHDHMLMQVLRSRADAVLMGAGTLRALKAPANLTDRKLMARRGKVGRSRNPLNIIVTSNPNFDLNWPFFKNHSVQRLLVVPATLPDSRIKKYKKSCEILRYTSAKKFPLELISFLTKKGLSNLLLEGGGGTLFQFAALDLIDEWNVTLTPKIIGGVDAPTLVDGEGFVTQKIKTYRLKKLKRIKNEIYLTYVRSL